MKDCKPKELIELDLERRWEYLQRYYEVASRFYQADQAVLSWGFMLTWAGFFELWVVHPELELYAGRDAKTMVKSLRNCPSIVMWVLWR